MSECGFLINDEYLRHDPGPEHPESPQRLLAIKGALEKSGAHERWRKLHARPVPLEVLGLVHEPGHIEHIESVAKRAPACVDPDTFVSVESYQVALMAAGGVLTCIDALCGGDLRRAFAFIRPPGHHAEPDRGMGFCLFNNVAVAAAYARSRYKLERIAVVDIDVHHGNGTQACFYDDPNVLYVSSHQSPFYPGSGSIEEIGTQAGKGYTLNFPLPEGSGNEVFVPLYSAIVSSVLERYQPQLVLVSAGFDAHYKDPLGGLRVTTPGYASVAASLMKAADRSCGGRICFVLEGGYNMEALHDCSRAVMTEMELESPKELQVPEVPLFLELSDRAKRSFGQFWDW